VAANAAIEALIERRRKHAKPGIAVAWGPIADSGILTRAGAAAETVARRVGGSLLKTRDALACLDRVLHENLAMVAVAVVRWADARDTLRGISTARFADVLGPLGDEETRGPADIREAIAHLPPDEALALVQDTLIATLSDVLRLPVDKIRGTTRVSDIGLDSLLGVELALALEARFKISLGRAAIAGQPTVGHLAATVLRALNPTGSEDVALIEVALKYEGETALAPHS
jgi:acyl carrier protein